MDHKAVAEEQIVLERIRRKIEDIKAAGQSQLSPIQEHISFTLQFAIRFMPLLNNNQLQQAYFKCAHECFEKRRTKDVTNNCVELCRVPVVNSQQRFDSEMAKFQERMNRSLMVCQDKFEAAKLVSSIIRIDAVKDLEDCVTDAATTLLGS
ncbi:PREDICTED: protein FAM136A-like isoform X2 [Camelina sativa]|uniref:Protein FAM136A-like isoform X2 n=1 Tax=Camelina sativa TaxID=90675 RepID=A0ABM0WRX2_CAMSA|nr:PREDICTED: protein FAM136A-like isoform X2 [Camelina sativa]